MAGDKTREADRQTPHRSPGVRREPAGRQTREEVGGTGTGDPKAGGGKARVLQSYGMPNKLRAA